MSDDLIFVIANEARTERAELKFGWPKPLSELHKREFGAELSKLEPWISRGELNPLMAAIGFLRMLEVEPPDWIYSAIEDHLYKQGMRNKRLVARHRQLEIDCVRWATVTYLRTSRRLSWERSYDKASQHLQNTRAAGTEETMRSSYKRYQRDPYIISLKTGDKPGALDHHARSTFEFYTDRWAKKSGV